MKTIALLLFAALFVGPLYGQTREDLLNRLADLQKKGYMVGHQDDPFYGLKWSGIADPQKPERGRSDVKEVVGDYPAVMGFDLGGIEMGDEKNLDSVPFSRIREELLAHVAFANGWIQDDDGRVLIYYATADTRMHVAVSSIDRLIDYCMNTPEDGLCTSVSVENIKKLINKNKNNG